MDRSGYPAITFAFAKLKLAGIHQCWSRESMIERSYVFVRMPKSLDDRLREHAGSLGIGPQEYIRNLLAATLVGQPLGPKRKVEA